jgi:hypothetical protein
MKIKKLQWLVICTVLAIILSSCNLGATPAPTQDIGAIQTQAFNQVLTQVALASTPTPLPTYTALPATPTLILLPTFAPVGGESTATPFPFNAAQPGVGLTPLASPVPPPVGVVATFTTKNGCNDGTYIDEAPYYTDSGHYLEVSIGQVVEQFFQYKNTGTCTWDEGYAFAFQPQYSSPEIEGNTIILAKDKVKDYTSPGNQVRYKAIVKAPKAHGDYKAAWKLRDDGGNLFGSLVTLYIRVR